MLYLIYIFVITKCIIHNFVFGLIDRLKQGTTLLFKIFDFFVYKFFGDLKLLCQTTFTHKLSTASIDKLFISTDVDIAMAMRQRVVEETNFRRLSRRLNTRFNAFETLA